MLDRVAQAFAPEVIRSSGALDGDAEVARFAAMVARRPRESAMVERPIADDGGLLLFSSGTTGRPRAIVRNAAALGRVADTLHQEIDFGPRETVLSYLPMHHAYGLEHALLAPIVGGAAVDQRSMSGCDPVATLIESSATIFPATPILLESLAHRGDEIASTRPPTSREEAMGDAAVWTAQELDPGRHRVRRIYSAGTMLPESVARAVAQRFAVRVDDLYGASEVGTITLSDGEGSHRVRGVELRVVDPDESGSLIDRLPGEIGEIVVRSDAMFDGYLDDRREPPRRERTIDGFFRTGDLGVIGPCGPKVVGRLKLQFDIGGLKVNAEAVERVLAAAPGVGQSLVVAVPVTASLCRLRAVIEPRPGATIDLDAVLEFARARLAPHEVPRDFEVIERLPRTPSGKLLRGPLMERVDAGR